MVRGHCSIGWLVGPGRAKRPWAISPSGRQDISMPQESTRYLDDCSYYQCILKYIYTIEATGYSSAQEKSQPNSKYTVFNQICRDFQPVLRWFNQSIWQWTFNFCSLLRHFISENSKSYEEWFAKRQAYTRSVATSSIVGFILGLGDRYRLLSFREWFKRFDVNHGRHPFNILLDKTTAEVVHIDLGLAFDQAKLLKIPETVPFRLTRDIVDGFGSSGVEGVFRNSCEKTMTVMRANKASHANLFVIHEINDDSNPRIISWPYSKSFCLTPLFRREVWVP